MNLVQFQFPPEEISLIRVQQALATLADIDGFIGACVFDSTDGMMLAFEGGGHALDLEVASALNVGIVRAHQDAIKSLRLSDEIDDIFLTLGKQYHVIRPITATKHLFFYLVIDRLGTNLAIARMRLQDAEKSLAAVLDD